MAHNWFSFRFYILEFGFLVCYTLNVFHIVDPTYTHSLLHVIGGLTLVNPFYNVGGASGSSNNSCMATLALYWNMSRMKLGVQIYFSNFMTTELEGSLRLLTNPFMTFVTHLHKTYIQIQCYHPKSTCSSCQTFRQFLSLS